ncbi:MAG: hypothetical protein ABH851_00880 [Methanobacteriota archaeon]
MNGEIYVLEEEKAEEGRRKEKVRRREIFLISLVFYVRLNPLNPSADKVQTDPLPRPFSTLRKEAF